MLARLARRLGCTFCRACHTHFPNTDTDPKTNHRHIYATACKRTTKSNDASTTVHNNPRAVSKQSTNDPAKRSNNCENNNDKQRLKKLSFLSLNIQTIQKPQTRIFLHINQTIFLGLINLAGNIIHDPCLKLCIKHLSLNPVLDQT